jgi:hypothetical protein
MVPLECIRKLEWRKRLRTHISAFVVAEKKFERQITWYSGTRIRFMKGKVMALQKLRRMVGRLVVIAALALTIGVGSVAVSSPAQASAQPRLTCAQAYQVAKCFTMVGNDAYSVGDYAAAASAYGTASEFLDWC